MVYNIEIFAVVNEYHVHFLSFLLGNLDSDPRVGTWQVSRKPIYYFLGGSRII